MFMSTLEVTHIHLNRLSMCHKGCCDHALLSVVVNSHTAYLESQPLSTIPFAPRPNTNLHDVSQVSPHPSFSPPPCSD